MDSKNQDQVRVQQKQTSLNHGDLKSARQKGMLVVSLAILALILVGYFFVRNYSARNDGAIEQALVNNDTNAEPKRSGFTPDSSEAQCADFPDYLTTCTQYSCTFIHPLTGDELVKRIDGQDSKGACLYYEQLPNGGQMDCVYTEGMRIASAEYYRDIMAAESFGTEVQGSLSPNGSEYTATYTIDGLEVANPLQEALINGQCIVSGYN